MVLTRKYLHINFLKDLCPLEVTTIPDPPNTLNKSKLDLSSLTSRPTMVFRTIPAKSSNKAYWEKVDQYIKEKNIEKAETLLNYLHGYLVDNEERSLWFDRTARMLFLRGDYTGSVKAMHMSIKNAMASVKNGKED